MKCSVFIATSVDGFIAGVDGDIEWLHRPEFDDAMSLGLTYSDFISTVDAIMMGRNSFEKVITFDQWYYEGTEVIVLTSRQLEIPVELEGKVRGMNGSPEEILSKLASEGKQHLYIDGGITIQRFLEAGLIDEITITEIPILLGSGIPLFGNVSKAHLLKLIEVKASERGVVQKRYKVER
jgi:dihydrofolate reductase